MRANEFITERQRVDEVVPLVLGGLTAAGLGMQAYKTYKDIEQYRKGEISKDELIRRGYTDAAIAAAGGVIGKAASGAWALGKGGLGVIKNMMKSKEAAKTASDATKLAKPGTTIQTPKGPRVAGVDGKPTVVDPTKRGARADIAKIKKQDAKQPDAVKPGAAAAIVGKKADDVAKKKPGGGKPGAATASMGSKIAKSPITRGAGIAALANQTTGAGDYIADFLKGVQDIKDREARGDYGQKKYLYKGKKDIGQDKVVKIGAQNPDPNRVIPGKS